MPLFVILEHDHPVLHWDLMLEYGDVLKTWRLAEPPKDGKSIAAVSLGDHRKFYLDYEGPVSGARGHVKRWEFGSYILSELTPARLRVNIKGTRLCGTALLVSQQDGQCWFQFNAQSQQVEPA